MFDRLDDAGLVAAGLVVEPVLLRVAGRVTSLLLVFVRAGLVLVVLAGLVEGVVVCCRVEEVVPEVPLVAFVLPADGLMLSAVFTRAGLACVFLVTFGRYISTDLLLTLAVPGRVVVAIFRTGTEVRVTR